MKQIGKKSDSSVENKVIYAEAEKLKHQNAVTPNGHSPEDDQKNRLKK